MRLFTVYGPWGRPDMALFKFTKSIIAGTPIEVYGAGKMTRDFTYVDDVVEAISRLAGPRRRRPAMAKAPYRVVNVGGGQPVGLEDFIAIRRSSDRPQGHSSRPADAARRRAGDLGERRAAGAADRIPAGDALERRRSRIRGMVSRVSSRLR